MCNALIARSLIILMLVGLPLVATAAKPNPGEGDCYNRCTETCNEKHPDGDWGDGAYRECIEECLDWCDVNEPGSFAIPSFDEHGRLNVVEPSPPWWQFWK